MGLGLNYIWVRPIGPVFNGRILQVSDDLSRTREIRRDKRL